MGLTTKGECPQLLMTKSATNIEGHPAPATTPPAIVACFFFSGLAGLIYEVVWARQLSLFLGITSYAHAAVITAYMLGLAAGSLYFGWRADNRSQPVKTYAWLEVGIGIYAAMTPWLFSGLQSVYVGIADISGIGEMSGYLARFAITLLALLLPTFLMGGTLPLLVRGVLTELPGLGKITGRFYGINTLGAMLGTLLAGYLLLPLVGVKATILVGVVINFGVAVIVLATLRHSKLPMETVAYTGDDIKRPPAVSAETRSRASRMVLLAGFGVAGFAALLTQMAWIRALILVVGGSVYAFTITLASFLAGIGLGSLLYTRFMTSPVGWLDRFQLGGRMAQATLLALLITLTLLLGLPLIGQLPGWFLAGYPSFKDNFSLFQLYIFLLSFSVMILPTLFMGALFPLVTVIWTRSINRAGRGVGVAYAVNATGTILGALFGGLFILPRLGVQHSVQLAAGLYFFVAVAYWLISGVEIRPVYRHAVTICTGLLILSVGLATPPWNTALMISGVFATPGKMVERLPDSSLQQIVEQNELLYYKEGLDAVVAVRRHGDDKSLVINGKADASAIADLPTQVLLGQIPMALDRKPENALVIGLGSGITAGTLAVHESLRQLTILEISEEVIEASELFVRENYGVLKDPRVDLVTADARNFLMATNERYDLIVSEPSNPWISGISNLFTDEFFKLAKRRLSAGGVMSQWIHTYRMSNDDLRTILKTFADNFQHVSLWMSMAEDLVIIGSDQPHALSMAHTHSDQSSVIAREWRRAKVDSFRGLVRRYVLGGDTLSSYVMGAQTNSDSNPVIEFSAPKNLYRPTAKENLADIFESLEGRKQPVPITGLVYQSDGQLAVDFMSLKIKEDDEHEATGLAPSWSVEWRLVGGEYSVGSERVLTWQEGASRYYVKAVWGANFPPLNKLLENTMRTTGRQGGAIHLPGGVDAVWLAGGTAGSLQLRLEILWDCPAPYSGNTRYALSARQHDPGKEKWNGELTRLAGRLRCE